jgi:hypothetical protein
MDQSQRLIIKRLGILFAVFVLAVIAHSILLSPPVITLASEQELAGQISQTLGATANGALPGDGQDYTFTASYFDNDSWAVASIKPLDSSFDPSVIVFHKQSGAYQTSLGPGSEFTSAQFLALPQDVATYLSTVAGTYTPAGE